MDDALRSISRPYRSGNGTVNYHQLHESGEQWNELLEDIYMVLSLLQVQWSEQADWAAAKVGYLLANF